MTGKLTPYQERMVRLMGQGMTVQQAATECGRSLGSGRTALQQARMKLGARNTTHAVVLLERLTPPL